MKSNKPKASYWIISAIALLWNAMGVNAYIQQAYQTESFKAMYTEEQLQLIAEAPIWSTAAFALAVFGGFFGAVALIMRKKWAHYLFIFSMIAVLVQMYYNFIIIDSLAVYGPGATIMPIMIIVFGLILIWYSKYAMKKNWII
ncbi:hypothetical protein ACFS5J_02270 [Flavobacterium chuncheonense]|uniref:Sugar transporter n=1 Tax=Flavobacterium chuncheonense TaxID=2026653 RepID=A0ABW5YIG5_9FLAO